MYVATLASRKFFHSCGSWHIINWIYFLCTHPHPSTHARRGTKLQVFAPARIQVGLGWLWLESSTILPICQANSAKFSSAKANSARRWYCLNQSQPNPVIRAYAPPCTESVNRNKDNNVVMVLDAIWRVQTSKKPGGTDGHKNRRETTGFLEFNRIWTSLSAGPCNLFLALKRATVGKNHKVYRRSWRTHSGLSLVSLWAILGQLSDRRSAGGEEEEQGREGGGGGLSKCCNGFTTCHPRATRTIGEKTRAQMSLAPKWLLQYLARKINGSSMLMMYILISKPNVNQISNSPIR